MGGLRTSDLPMWIVCGSGSNGADAREVRHFFFFFFSSFSPFPFFYFFLFSFFFFFFPPFFSLFNFFFTPSLFSFFSPFFTFFLSFLVSFLFVPDHPHCHSTALVFSLDVTSTVMTRMHVRSSMRAHSPLSGSSVNGSCAQDAEQKHCKHGSGALLSSFLLLFVVVLVERGCLSSVDRDRELRIWSERETRRNECETRCWLPLERVRNSLLESFQNRRLSIGCWS